MKKILEKLGLSKRQLILLICTFIVGRSIYTIGGRLAATMHHYNLSIPLDNVIPLIPWTILIYHGCYVFYAINYYLSTRYDKGGGGYCFIDAHYLGMVAFFMFYVSFPTVMTRPNISATTVFDWLLCITYEGDGPTNLFPSLHCFSGWLCYIGVRNNKNIPKWYQIVSCILALVVCASTLTVKQHVIVDVPSGILLAELCYLLSTHINKKITRKSIN